MLSARVDGSCVAAPPPIVALVVCSLFTVSRRVCCSSCRASTWLNKARMAWSRASCLLPGRGARVFSFSAGDLSSMMLSLSGSGSSGPSQCFPITAKSCRSFDVPQPGHFVLHLDLFFEDIAEKRAVRRRGTANS